MGTKYHPMDYVVTGWQDNDLPLFGCIQEIIIVNENALFSVLKCTTLGIERHFHSFVVRRTGEVAMYWLSELADYQALQAHLLNDRLYITFRTHIEKL